MTSSPHIRRIAFFVCALLLTFAVVGFLRPLVASADADPRALCPVVETGPTWENSLGVPDLGVWDPNEPLTIFLWFFYAAMALTVVLALLFIVIGGTRYVAGAGNSGQQGKAKTTIQNAILGLVLVLASTLILYTINPSLTALVFPSLTDTDGDLLGSADQSFLDWTLEYCECLKTEESVIDCQAIATAATGPVPTCIREVGIEANDCTGKQFGAACTVNTPWNPFEGNRSGQCTPQGTSYKQACTCQ